MSQEEQEDDDVGNYSDLVLTSSQIASFFEKGILVVPNVLTDQELQTAKEGLSNTLLRHGVDVNDLESTAHHLQALSSTNGSGGVLDIYYDEWKLSIIATHPKLFAMTQQLWHEIYNTETTTSTTSTTSTSTASRSTSAVQYPFPHHPYGSFDSSKGYAYIDRIGYRIPTKLAQQVGQQQKQQQHHTNKKNKVVPIQRSLTPHLDCCPTDLYPINAVKWRPIQCLVSLTDTLEPMMGGFEAAPGFHTHFHTWTKSRPPTIRTSKQHGTQTLPAPCIGPYTHIRPHEDATVLPQIQHVPVPAGAAVFWDVRIPHANAYHHLGRIPRSVVYCSFLPNIPLNQRYIQRCQVPTLRKNTPPTNDSWRGPPPPKPTTRTNVTRMDHDDNHDTSTTTTRIPSHLQSLTHVQLQLLGLVPWSTTNNKDNNETNTTTIESMEL